MQGYIVSMCSNHFQEVCSVTLGGPHISALRVGGSVAVISRSQLCPGSFGQGYIRLCYSSSLRNVELAGDILFGWPFSTKAILQRKKHLPLQKREVWPSLVPCGFPIPSFLLRSRNTSCSWGLWTSPSKKGILILLNKYFLTQAFKCLMTQN